jgi:hypothetical protein
MIHDPNSLANTIDHINELLFLNKPIDADEGMLAARWIASRAGKEGSYRGLSAPTPYDFDHGMHTFTGEVLKSAGARHIMGQEAARIAWLLGNADSQVREAYHQSTDWMQPDPRFQSTGMYCCGICTLAFWRHFWVGDFTNKESQVNIGLQTLRDHRRGDGEWRRFPFFFGIYTLLDLDMDAAIDELKYAQPVMERYIGHARSGLYSDRKQIICRRALEKIS